MDSFAYLQLALAWETPTNLQLLPAVDWQKLSGRAYTQWLSLALALWILSVASTAMAALGPGDNGPAVQVLQQRLKDLGFFPRNQPTSIYYREITEDAVRRYQQARGFSATGIADDRTLIDLRLKASSPASQGFSPSGVNASSGSIRTCEGLRFGDQSALVKLLQQQLKALGYFYGAVDGKYRERTLNAVTRFQQANNLTPTGCADSNTLDAINYGISELQTSAPQYIPSLQTQPVTSSNFNTSSRVLRRGNTGSEVRNLQLLLRRAGRDPGPIDGEFGGATEYAVLRFQEIQGLYPNGVAGPDTLNRLQNFVVRAVPSNPISVLPAYPGAGVQAPCQLTSQEVRLLQTRLRERYLYTGPVNGIYDARTQAAVAQAQLAYNVSAQDIVSGYF